MPQHKITTHCLGCDYSFTYTTDAECSKCRMKDMQKVKCHDCGKELEVDLNNCGLNYQVVKTQWQQMDWYCAVHGPYWSD